MIIIHCRGTLSSDAIRDITSILILSSNSGGETNTNSKFSNSYSNFKFELVNLHILFSSFLPRGGDDFTCGWIGSGSGCDVVGQWLAVMGV